MIKKLKKSCLCLFLFLYLLISNDLFSKVLWADKVIGFSSQFSNKEFSANQILGEPSVTSEFGFSSAAWLPKFPSERMEWIRIKYSEPIFISQIAINENLNPGAIVNVFIYDSIGKGYSVFANNQPVNINRNNKMFNIFVDNTEFRTDEIKIEINTVNYHDRYQIDAVAISDSKEPVNVKINEAADFNFDIIKENLGPKVNSLYPELAPIISQDGKTLFFTRDSHPGNFGIKKKQDVWYSKVNEKGEFEEAVNIGTPINNDDVNFAISVSPDAHQILLGNIYLPNNELRSGFSVSTYNGSEWSFPDSLKITNYYNIFENGSYCRASNGKIFLMAIKRNDTFGKSDLYVSFLDSNGVWSEPVNLGKEINTAEDEISPFLASDNKTLYFSTTGRPGYGDYDMFVTRRIDSTWIHWTKPQNLGKKINTAGWDAYYTLTASGDYAYFVSSENSIGKADIFRIKLPVDIKPEPVLLVSGKVLNSKTNKPIEAKIRYETLPDGIEAGIAVSNALTGEYKIVLPTGKKYGFMAEAKGFASINENLDLINLSVYKEIQKDLILVSIEKGEIIRINNIFFDFGEYKLLEDSYAELNRLVILLNENLSMKIRINGHTDNIGNVQDNQILSENRAKAVKSFLISKGINPKRVITKGFGKLKPLANNNTEEGRQKNRRVEFEIISL
jgi:outer membrane protein OmpA-like peptidoglycan-associated protein